MRSPNLKISVTIKGSLRAPLFLWRQNMTKRIRIIRRGVFRSGTDMIPVGTELDVPDDFSGWNGKWVEVSGTEGKTLEVATPEPEPEEDDSELRDQYEQVIGKRPGPRMKAETMQRHIDEALEE